jgi:hypothetical protein
MNKEFKAMAKKMLIVNTLATKAKIIALMTMITLSMMLHTILCFILFFILLCLPLFTLYPFVELSYLWNFVYATLFLLTDFASYIWFFSLCILRVHTLVLHSLFEALKSYNPKEKEENIRRWVLHLILSEIKMPKNYPYDFTNSPQDKENDSKSSKNKNLKGELNVNRKI